MKPGLTLAATVLWTVVLAIGSNLTLDAWQSPEGLSSTFEQNLADRFTLFLLGAFLLWLVVILTLSVTGRLWATTAIVVVLTASTGYANRAKLDLRLEPLYPSDLQMVTQVGFLADMVGWRPVLGLLVVVAVAVVIAVFGGRLASRWFPPLRRYTDPRLATGVLVARVCAGVLSAVLLAHAANFNNLGNSFRAAYEAEGVLWKPWDQMANYRENGFVAGMLFNTWVPGMTTPADYSEQTMRDLAAKYADVAARLNEGRDPDALDDVDVVLALSETLTDPTRLRGVTFAEDPIPFTRKLMQRTTSGQMLASQFGGGTANVEFSALTGLSLSQFQPQMTTPYQMLVPNYDDFPSLVGYLEAQGHRTRAIHPFLPSLYRRSEVYPAFGFDSAVFAEDMTHQERLESSEYISDAAAFEEVGEALSDLEGPAFVNLVTMQNHMPMAGSYNDPIRVAGVEDPWSRANAQHYARGLRHSDQALKTFLSGLRRTDEKTVVLLYGDHQPALWPTEIRDANGVRAMLETPFLVWSNFGDSPVRTLPTTSPIHFGPLLLDHVGATLPPYFALLSMLRQEVPGLDNQVLIGPDDRWLRPDDLSPRARELLHDFRLVQYDLSIGERYSQRELFYAPDEAGQAAG